MTHELKIRPNFFNEVLSGEKTFEIRKNDRKFKVGDLIELKECDKETGYTGRSAIFDITYVMTDREYVKKGFAVLGIKRHTPLNTFLEALRKAAETKEGAESLKRAAEYETQKYDLKGG